MIVRGSSSGREAAAYPLSDAAELERILGAMSRRLHARHQEPFHLVGIRRRGVPLARKLARRLAGLGRDVLVGEVTLKRYDDDLSLLHRDPEPEEQEPLPFEAEGARIVLVDDVVFSGRTLLEATGHFVRKGASAVEAVVVCARGEPDLAVRAATVGMRLDVGPDTIVEVHVPPYEDDAGIRLRRRPAESGS